MKTLMVSHLLPLLGRGRDPRAQRYRGARESSGGAEPCAARSPVTKGQLSTCSASPPDLPVVPGSESHSRNGNSVASAPDLQLKVRGTSGEPKKRRRDGRAPRGGRGAPEQQPGEN